MKSPFKLSLISLAILAPAASAEEIPLYLGNEILVTATRIAYSDADAPYASEVHTRAMIEQSGAATLYDYLAQRTSVQVLPSYGNKFTPKMDMRGYGVGDGYQNIVVSLDGQRLNNIDGVPQLLGAIPLASIDRIEITRGSGSVIYGDGATAGSIQIHTRPHKGVSVGLSAGNFGALAGTLAGGFSNENVALSVSADSQSQGGYSDADKTGHKDHSRLDAQRAKLSVKPVERAWLHFDGSTSSIDTRYPNALTPAKFQANPAQNGNTNNAYTHQIYETNQWRLGTEIELSRQVKLTVSHNQEDKLSKYVPGSPSTYDYATNDLALVYKGDALDITAGTQAFDGARIGSTNRTSKNNAGYYVQGQYRLDSLALSLGARRETVEYSYAPTTGVALHDAHHLRALDMGLNYRLNKKAALFANYNQSFQAPDIDRFFVDPFYDGNVIFNAFIAPAEIKTLTAGINHVENNNRLKLAVFRANLKNEIYLVPDGSYKNTNIDQSHKYGLELQDNWRVRPDLSLSANYTYTRAIIDRENDGGGAYNGKDLPGVPRHGVVLGLGYDLSEKSALNISHVWRSTAYAADDFANNFTQKQAAYQSTGLAYRYRHKAFEWSASIDNLFEHKNGLWINDNGVYPVSFTRNFRLGFKAGL